MIFLKNFFFIVGLSGFMVLNSKAADLVQVAEKAGNFKILLTAANEAGLVVTLKSSGPFTILAPTDEAFGKLPKGTLEDLLKPENKNQLISILKYHVISGKVPAQKVASLSTAKTLEGEVKINIKDGRIMVNNSNVVGSDIQASNGIIHVIDQVLLPPQPKTPQEQILSVIEEAIDLGVPLYNSGNREACAGIYRIVALSVVNIGADFIDTKTKEQLKEALRRSYESKNFSTKAWTLRGALDHTYNNVKKMTIKTELTDKMPLGKKDDSFKVILEADLPEGFPKPGPVDEIVVKEYPQYRAAKVDGAGMQNVAFMRLFAHIKQNGISMTAPVEMALDGDSAKRQSMAFLYGNKKIGETGTTGSGVEVLDLPAQKFVSIGMKGTESSKAVKAAVSKLNNWLKENKDYEAAGEPRLLGYNSPMVPSSKRFWEVQIPVN